MTDPVTFPTEMKQVQDAIDRLLALCEVNVHKGWRYCIQDLPQAIATQSTHWHDWLRSELNTKGYIVWAAGRQVIWLSQLFIVPDDLQGYPLSGLALRLALTWWAEDAQIFVNGQLVQQGDLFDSSARVLLSSSVKPGEEFAIALRLVSPGHDLGGLMRSKCLYESTDIDPGFIADELTVFAHYLNAFNPEKLADFATIIPKLDLSPLSQHQDLIKSLSTIRQSLQLFCQENPELPQLKQRGIKMLGHAHLDLAWLWTVSETWKVAQRTFESVLALQKEFPSLTFCHSTPALYAWIEQHRPDLFSEIRQQIAAGRWEVVGGMWVEPDVNLPNGESLIRQVLYAQRYVLEKFGQVTKTAWLPDSFGFCWQLPQILKQGGIKYFVTQKLHWNDTTKFPYGVFWWQSPDGTKIFSLMSPPNTTGVMDTNPITMAAYAVDWEIQTNLKEAFWLPGVGDHGGGPTRDMLQVASRWQQSPFFPKLEFTTAQNYLSGILGNNPEKTASNQQEAQDFPVWNDELYLEFHRGCYTTHADQKRWNRHCENLLYQAELWATFATLLTTTNYPKLEIEAAWKKVLFNQFHDILPGTSIAEVFVEANIAWQDVEKVGLEILDLSLKAIASQITLPSPPQPNAQPIIVFNSLNWERSEVITVPFPTKAKFGQTWQVYDCFGEKQASQQGEESLLFLAKNISAVGYRLFWLCWIEGINLEDALIKPGNNLLGTPVSHNKDSIPQFLVPNTFEPKDWILENELLLVIVDAKTGNLSRIFDKSNNREVLKKEGGNQLQTFQDLGQYWDAWNIDPNYEQHPNSATQLRSIQWLEQGQVQQSLRVVRQFGQSQFCQDYILDVHSPVLKIATTIDWQEQHVLLKAAFPLNLEANYATYEIACGAIQRPTQAQTPAEQAKWEVPALRWADLGDDTYGVSLLNDCKYGYDAQPSQLRLTLLRSSCWPDPDADQGFHQFTYALYPHAGSWQSAETVRRGYELNLPLKVVSDIPMETGCTSLKPVGKFLDLQAENLVLIAFKPSEDDPGQYVMRCYECQGDTAELSISSDLNLAIAFPVDLLERPTPRSEQRHLIPPWKIASFRIERPPQTQSPL